MNIDSSKERPPMNQINWTGSAEEKGLAFWKAVGVEPKVSDCQNYHAVGEELIHVGPCYECNDTGSIVEYPPLTLDSLFEWIRDQKRVSLEMVVSYYEGSGEPTTSVRILYQEKWTNWERARNPLDALALAILRFKGFEVKV